MLIDWIAAPLAVFLAVRVLQRFYFLFVSPPPQRSTGYSWRCSPRAEMEKWIEDSCVLSTNHSVRSSLDGVLLHYRLLGSGRKIYYLANGVGTDFFMWLPCLQALLDIHPTLFEEVTLVVSPFRGLFADHIAPPVDISLSACMQDIADIAAHLKLDAFDGLIGWSTGAQVGYNLAVRHPRVLRSLFLVGPAAGCTLEYLLQPLLPWPAPLRRLWSSFLVSLVRWLRSLVPTRVFDVLQQAVDSDGFYALLVAVAFLGGFPALQSVYFHEYMRDTFRSRGQVCALLDLVLSLNTPQCVGEVPQQIAARTVLVSAWPDFLTGCHLAEALERELPGSRHVRSRLGSHWLLLEWPRWLATEMARFVRSGEELVR